MRSRSALRSAFGLTKSASPCEEVKGACEILGLGPLYVAHDGKLVAVVEADGAEAIVGRMRENPYGRDAAIIGEVEAEPRGIVQWPLD
jgi:hydrogenase expression/formation protein HypE